MEIQHVIERLERNNMKGYYIKDLRELPVLLESLIPKGASVGSGDSVTLEQTGVFDFLRQGCYDFYDKHDPALTKMEKRELYIRNFSCHTFLTGCNAVTADGKLFNNDGNGSRVAPMLYGPRQVIVIAGTNKLVETVEAAVARARQVAAPLDAVRLGKSAPCVKLGRCIDCGHADRICNSFVLIARQFDPERIKVILLEGAFGY